MGFEQLAKLRDELAKQAKAQRKEKQAAEKPAHTSGKDTNTSDTKARDARRPARPAAKTTGKPASGRPASGKPASARPEAKQNPVDPVVHTIGKLQKRFPLAFPKNPAPKVALKIGILDDLLAQAAELKLTEQEVRDAVSTWCRGSRYWASLTEGASRVDLNGAETGKVTASESAFARRRSGGRNKPAAAKAGGETAAAAVTATAAETNKPVDDAAAVTGTNDEGDAPAADQAQG
ncbi:ProQ/FinO family protein [Burkholderia sp. Ac-20365]|uniref:ProQ/FinO family protein n=1 Tax=Burkholderia sp. Ac-20365 TaxID=2703897 RepID=UPI00197C11E6|nr:ProQ/FinO family protein [Burkholderia sp. Ac-20365]MBN3767938.1 ProQ activator of osmoprotectant transporter prop [Burkholderia sp. Ac-20365]